MSESPHYAPILRWKAGEKRALRDLPPAHKARITPLIEWSRPGEVTPLEDRKRSTPQPRDLSGDILKHWGCRSFFCDLTWFWVDKLDRDAEKLRRYAEELAGCGLRPIPVLSVSDAADYWNALAPLTRSSGLCVRVQHADVVAPALADRIDRLLLTTRHAPAEVDLVADYGMHYRDSDIATLCTLLPHIPEYRTFTVAAGSFPRDLREFKGPQVVYLTRHEWVRYHDQVQKGLPRQPAFGDYATLHPVLTQASGGLNPSASIRYTTDDAWLVMKGEGLHNDDGPGYEQYHGNAALLTQRREYRGPTFSAGDRCISDTARRMIGPGNPTTWVQAGVNQHVTFVGQQVSEFFETVSAPARVASAPTERRMLVRGSRRPFPGKSLGERVGQSEQSEEGGSE